MDPLRFDALTRVLGQVRGRRQLLGVLSALPIVGVLVGLPDEIVEAERPRDRLRRRKAQKRRKQRNRKGDNGNSNGNKSNNGNGKTNNNKKNKGGGLGDPQGCTLPGQACQQNTDCCKDNCFNQVCADPPNTCGGANCPVDATGCCPVDGCCSPPSNQCNAGGLCCAPNCGGKQCGPDGCGGAGTCGTCAPGQTCNLATAQCEGPICGPRSCPHGCCDANGVCQPGTAQNQCGRGGIACYACSQYQYCSAETGTCRDLPPCTAETCPNGCCFEREDGFVVCRTDLRGCTSGGACCAGCCDENDVCQPGTEGSACGADASRCLTCTPAGAVCDQGRCQCDADNCPNGCCENGPGNPGRCLDNDPGACGTGGVQCTFCDYGLACNAQGQCECTIESCSDPGMDCVANRCLCDSSCTGCCQDNRCKPGNTPRACARGGDCVVCEEGGVCIEGRCCPGGSVRICGEGQFSQCCSGVCCDGGCCPAGESCCDDGQCCPAGGVCCEGGGCCPAGGFCCNGHCCASSEDWFCCESGCCRQGGVCCGGGCCDGEINKCCNFGGNLTCGITC